MDDKHVFALIVTGAEKRADNGDVMAKAGQRYWVLQPGKEGHGVVSSTQVRDQNSPPPEILTFGSAAEAHAFARKWNGHPWWCAPVAYQVTEVSPKFRMVPDGFETVAATSAISLEAYDDEVEV